MAAGRILGCRLQQMQDARSGVNPQLDIPGSEPDRVPTRSSSRGKEVASAALETWDRPSRYLRTPATGASERTSVTAWKVHQRGRTLAGDSL